MISQGRPTVLSSLLPAAAPYLPGVLVPFSLCVMLCVYTPLTLHISYGLP